MNAAEFGTKSSQIICVNRNAISIISNNNDEKLSWKFDEIYVRATIFFGPKIYNYYEEPLMDAFLHRCSIWR